ncbi:MAG TPA: hypothetical protein VIL29_08465 [Pseudothermotoga sp.]|jgi:hypothetical protein
MREAFKEILKDIGYWILENPWKFFEFLICTPIVIFVIIILTRVFEFLENFGFLIGG